MTYLGSSRFSLPGKYLQWELRWRLEGLASAENKKRVVLLEKGPLRRAVCNPSYEPPHDKTNKMTCAPSEDSDQPGHSSSLIRFFAVRLRKRWALRYPLRLWSDWADSFCYFCHQAAQKRNHSKKLLIDLYIVYKYVINCQLHISW